MEQVEKEEAKESRQLISCNRYTMQFVGRFDCDDGDRASDDAGGKRIPWRVY